MSFADALNFLERDDYSTAVFPGSLTTVTDEETGDTLLHASINLGHVDRVPFLVASGAGAEAQNKAGERPIHLAVMHDCAEALQVLLNNGVDVNAENVHGMTPLHYAVIYGAYKSLPILLACFSINILAQDRQGWTALHYCAINADIEHMKVLLGSDGDLAFVLSHTGVSILHLMALGDTLRILKRANPFVRYDVSCDCRHQIEKYYAGLLARKPASPAASPAIGGSRDCGCDCDGGRDSDSDIPSYRSFLRSPMARRLFEKGQRDAKHGAGSFSLDSPRTPRPDAQQVANVTYRRDLHVFPASFERCIVWLCSALNTLAGSASSADVIARLFCRDAHGRTPLHYAAMYGTQTGFSALFRLVLSTCRIVEDAEGLLDSYVIVLSRVSPGPDDLLVHFKHDFDPIPLRYFGCEDAYGLNPLHLCCVAGVSAFRVKHLALVCDFRSSNPVFCNALFCALRTRNIFIFDEVCNSLLSVYYMHSLKYINHRAPAVAQHLYALLAARDAFGLSVMDYILLEADSPYEHVAYLAAGRAPGRPLLTSRKTAEKHYLLQSLIRVIGALPEALVAKLVSEYNPLAPLICGLGGRIADLFSPRRSARGGSDSGLRALLQMLFSFVHTGLCYENNTYTYGKAASKKSILNLSDSMAFTGSLAHTIRSYCDENALRMPLRHCLRSIALLLDDRGVTATVRQPAGPASLALSTILTVVKNTFTVGLLGMRPTPLPAQPKTELVPRVFPIDFNAITSVKNLEHLRAYTLWRAQEHDADLLRSIQRIERVYGINDATLRCMTSRLIFAHADKITQAMAADTFIGTMCSGRAAPLVLTAALNCTPILVKCMELLTSESAVALLQRYTDCSEDVADVQMYIERASLGDFDTRSALASPTAGAGAPGGAPGGGSTSTSMNGSMTAPPGGDGAPASLSMDTLERIHGFVQPRYKGLADVLTSELAMSAVLSALVVDNFDFFVFATRLMPPEYYRLDILLSVACSLAQFEGPAQSESERRKGGRQPPNRLAAFYRPRPMHRYVNFLFEKMAKSLEQLRSVLKDVLVLVGIASFDDLAMLSFEHSCNLQSIVRLLNASFAMTEGPAGPAGAAEEVVRVPLLGFLAGSSSRLLPSMAKILISGVAGVPLVIDAFGNTPAHYAAAGVLGVLRADRLLDPESAACRHDHSPGALYSLSYVPEMIRRSVFFLLARIAISAAAHEAFYYNEDILMSTNQRVQYVRSTANVLGSRGFLGAERVYRLADGHCYKRHIHQYARPGGAAPPQEPLNEEFCDRTIHRFRLLDAPPGGERADGAGREAAKKNAAAAAATDSDADKLCIGDLLTPRSVFDALRFAAEAALLHLFCLSRLVNTVRDNAGHVLTKNVIDVSQTDFDAMRLVFLLTVIHADQQTILLRNNKTEMPPLLFAARYGDVTTALLIVVLGGLEKAAVEGLKDALAARIESAGKMLAKKQKGSCVEVLNSLYMVLCLSVVEPSILELIPRLSCIELFNGFMLASTLIDAKTVYDNLPLRVVAAPPDTLGRCKISFARKGLLLPENLSEIS